MKPETERSQEGFLTLTTIFDVFILIKLLKPDGSDLERALHFSNLLEHQTVMENSFWMQSDSARG